MAGNRNHRRCSRSHIRPKKIPELGSALGKTLRGFKDELKTPSEDTNPEEEK